MERETKTIDTKSGHKIVVKSYLTYAEVEPILEKEGISNIKKSSELLKVAVISVDGVAENAYETIRKLPFGDYSEVSQEIAKLIGGDFTQAK